MSKSEVAAIGAGGCGLVVATCALIDAMYTAVIYFAWNDLVTAFANVQHLTLWQSAIAALVFSMITGVVRR